MTNAKDLSTSTSHQPELHPLDPEGQGRSDKQSPNRAGIPMLRGARADSANCSSDHHARTQIGPLGSDRRGF